MKASKRIQKYFRRFIVPNVTRGHGLLEYYLAKRRAKMANSLIPKGKRRGSILDIGCGNYPIFLITTRFFRKYGIDKAYYRDPGVRVAPQIVKCDIEKARKLPFSASFFDTVTMLAVFEHIRPNHLTHVLVEIYRVLKPGGVLIMTIPSRQAEWVLEILCALRLVSPIEIHEHKSVAANAHISRRLFRAGFTKVDAGHFEFFLNRWFVAKK